MEYGVFYLPTFYSEPSGDSAALYASLRAQARHAEALGFRSFWLAEHHFHGFGGMLPSPQVVIPALAAETTRLRFGTAVALLPFHHPLRLAEDYATVDVLSGGRLDFGVGVGFHKLEADNLGVPLESARERFHEHFEVILRAWSAERFDYEGRFGSYRNLCVLPKPVQQPHPPVWVAGSATPETFRWAGERGYSLLTMGFLHDVPTFKELIGAYRAAYRAAGHPPEGERVLGVYHAYAGTSAAEAYAVGARGMEWYVGASSLAREAAGVDRTYTAFPSHSRYTHTNRTLSFEEFLARSRVVVGEPAACREILAHLRAELDFTHLVFMFALGGLPHDDILRAMDRFADQVLGR